MNDEIEMESCVSSNISAIGHDADNEVLQVEFRDGSTYQYDGVSADVFTSLRDAGSVGGYFSRAIKGSYPARRV